MWKIQIAPILQNLLRDLFFFGLFIDHISRRRFLLRRRDPDGVAVHFDAEDVVDTTVARVVGAGIAARSGVVAVLLAAEMAVTLSPGMIEEFGLRKGCTAGGPEIDTELASAVLGV